MNDDVVAGCSTVGDKCFNPKIELSSQVGARELSPGKSNEEGSKWSVYETSFDGGDNGSER